VPVRQWVLNLPYRLRYVLAWDHGLARAVLAVSVRVLLGFQRHRARRYGSRAGRSGSVTVIQRFGRGLNLNVHFHTLLLDGVFFEGQEGALEFRPLPPPTDDEVGGVLARPLHCDRSAGFAGATVRGEASEGASSALSDVLARLLAVSVDRGTLHGLRAARYAAWATRTTDGRTSVRRSVSEERVVWAEGPRPGPAD
jgi:Putative transposase